VLTRETFCRVAFCSKSPHRVKSRGNTYYHQQLLLRYSYCAPVVPRAPECLAKGTGGIVLGDLGGRACTFIRMDRPGDAANEFELKGSEFFNDLSGKILDGCAKSEALLSRSGLSRSERHKDPQTQRYYETLNNRLAEAEAHGRMSETQLLAMRQQKNLGARHGAFGAEFKSGVETMAAEPNVMDGGSDAEQAMRQSMAEADAALKGAFEEEASRIAHAKSRMEEKRKQLLREGKDEFLGAEWTAEVEERYRRHCACRDEKGLPRRSRRFFLKYKVEKRERRRAKWIQWSIRRMVRNEQNAALAKIVPVGTSVVLCGRLNFHEFKRLSSRIRKYFGYLALASFHDRMEIRCENVGAVLLNVCEGYTTKQCFSCNGHVNVGAKKVFRCRCGYRRHRDLKGAFGQLVRSLFFVR
jgi:hypothetical protein